MDGTAPISESATAGSYIEQNEQYVRIFEQCAADPACNEAYPNLAERFTTLLNQLQETPLVLEEPITPTGRLVRTFGSSMAQIDVPFFRKLIDYNKNVSYYTQKEFSIVEQVPRIILAVEEGDLEYIRTHFGSIPDLPAAAEPVFEVPDEASIVPDNDYIAPTIATLLAEAQQVPAVANASTPAEQWVALVINNLVARLQSGEAQADVVLDTADLGILPAKGRDPQLLIDYANEHLPEALAAQANALVEPMSPADIRATMWHLNEVADAMRFSTGLASSFSQEILFATNCAEDLKLNTADAVDEVVAAAAYPQFAAGGVEGGKELFAFYELLCSFFPDTIIPRSFIEPVASDIPVLLLQGDLDVNTPTLAAREVASHLTNNTFVLFGTEGHVVAALSATCPGTIATQFLNDPTGALDVSCAEAYVIDFVLPESGATTTSTTADSVTSAIELTTNPWLWQSFTDPVESFELDNPEAYTVAFNSDGSVNIVADCNNASGSYTASDDGSLSIEIGPSTLAACPPESRSEAFIQKLGFVSNFFFENGILYLDTMADGGTFQLASASEHMP